MITVNDFIDIIELDATLPSYDYDLVGTILSYSTEQMEEMNIQDFIVHLEAIKKQIQIRKINPNDIWNGLNVGEAKDFNQITFGEYIDLESYLKNKDFNSFLKVIFKSDIDFLDCPLAILFYKIDEFEEFRKLITENYSSIFTATDDNDNDDEEERFISPAKTFSENDKKKKAETQKKWGWFTVAFNLAKNDITKIDEVMEQNFIKTLNILSMVSELQIQINPDAYPLY